MLDLILIISKAKSGAPFKVAVTDIDSVQREFKTIILYFTQISGHFTESTKTGKTLTHNHIVGLHEIGFQATTNPVVQETEVKPEVPGRCLFPFQVGISQTVNTQVFHINIIRTSIVTHCTSGTRSQICQSKIRVCQLSVTILTPRYAQLTGTHRFPFEELLINK